MLSLHPLRNLYSFTHFPVSTKVPETAVPEPVTAKFVEVVISGYDLPEDHSGFGNPAWIFVDEIEVH